MVQLFVIIFNDFQGRVRTKTVKRAAKKLIEKYYSKLRLDFDYNKLIIKEVAVV